MFSSVMLSQMSRFKNVKHCMGGIMMHVLVTKKPEYMPNGTLRCTKCEKDVLMTVPKYVFKLNHYILFHNPCFINLVNFFLSIAA